MGYNKFPRGVVNGHFDEDGYIKLIYEKQTGRIIGSTIVGEDADNLITSVAIAMRGGLSTEDLSSMMFFHPSLAEGIKFAARREVVGKKDEELCCKV